MSLLDVFKTFFFLFSIQRLMEQIHFHFNNCLHVMAHTSLSLHFHFTWWHATQCVILDLKPIFFLTYMQVYDCTLGCKLCQTASECTALLWLKWSSDTDIGLQLLLLCSFCCMASVDKVLAAALTEVHWERWGAVCASVWTCVQNWWLTVSLN